MTTQFDPNDPFQSACNPEPRSYWGQFDTDARFVVLQKGVGKVAFDPNQHDPQQKRTAITLTFAPLPEHNMYKPMVREHLDSDAAEWVKVTLASMKACAIADLRQLNGTWAKVQIIETRAVPTSTGGTFQKTAFKIVNRFADENACRADWQAKNGTQYGGATVAPVAQANGNGAAAPDAEKKVALAFLSTLLPKAIDNAANPAQAIARAEMLFGQHNLLGKHFTAASPEVVAFIAAKFGDEAKTAPEGEAQPAAFDEAAALEALQEKQHEAAAVAAKSAPAPVAAEPENIPF